MLCARLEVCVAIKIFVSFGESKIVLCLKTVAGMTIINSTPNALSQCICAAQKKKVPIRTKFESQFFDLASSY